MLSKRKERFCREYTSNGGNGAQAARDAGYSDTGEGAKVMACRLLTEPNVKQQIEALWSETVERLDISREQIVEGILAETQSNNASVRIRAWEMLAKIYGLLDTPHREAGQVNIELNMG